jgi:hypothetical protein
MHLLEGDHGVDVVSALVAVDAAEREVELV